MPEAFYGGLDPVVHYQTPVKEKPAIKKPLRPEIEKKPSGKPLVKSQTKGGGHSLASGRGIKIIAGVIFFLIVVVAISWYYVRQALPAVPETANANIDVNLSETGTEEPIVPEITKEEEEKLVPVTEEETVTSTPPSLVSPLVLSFPLKVFTNSADVDNDLLTDWEEEILGTDSGLWDSDGDGYYDGQEIYNLYNPKGFAPIKLIDSGLVAEYVNPRWQYRLYYPTAWQVGEVDTDKRQVLFSSLSGDYIEVMVFEKDSSLSFTDWFAQQTVGEQYSDLQPGMNRFQEPWQGRKDELVAYFPTAERILVLVYNSPEDGQPIAFRHLMQMMIQSFRPAKTLVELPPQVVMPVEGNEITTTSASTTIGEDDELGDW